MRDRDHVHLHLPESFGEALKSLVDVFREFNSDLKTLTRKVDKVMSLLGDKISAVEVALDTAIARVEADVTELKAKIDELQAKVDTGTATQEELDRLTALEAKLNGLDPHKPDVLPVE